MSNATDDAAADRRGGRHLESWHGHVVVSHREGRDPNAMQLQARVEATADTLVQTVLTAATELLVLGPLAHDLTLRVDGGATLHSGQTLAECGVRSGAALRVAVAG